MPHLHILAAGSLLEFALQDLPSFGVGRVRSLFVHPFSFNEFLNACSQSQLVEAIKSASDTSPLPELIHKKIIAQYKRIEEGIRLSLENFGKYQNIRTIPLYAVSVLGELNSI